MCEVWRVENVKPADRGSGEQKMADTAVCSSIDSGPLEAASSIYQFVSFLILTSAHLPSLSAGSIIRREQTAPLGNTGPLVAGQPHTDVMEWMQLHRGLCENSIKVVIRLES